MPTFWSAGPGPARILELIAPAGFEAYFVELAEAGDPGRRRELAAKYGVTYSSDWVAGLVSRYNLRLLGGQVPVVVRLALKRIARRAWRLHVYSALSTGNGSA